ncbi:MAG: hypothetical protein GWO11_08520, partial [Desulfuromonadales bacterium]|nr:hypothetical protein [Desulfuromonadales bacterium]NIR34341.1 hypothetical protein [Desulfuromonadales bacterium]NIS44307.1 hypothetical protein [Desulfuromonadales bacterium]
MPNDSPRPQDTKLSGQALQMLARLVKASAFYPRRHPTLQQTLDKCYQGLSDLLGGGEMIFTVKKSGFFRDDAPLATQTTVLDDLAQDLFARKVNRLMLLPDLQKRDIDFFVRTLAIPPQTLQRKGGLQELLIQADISSIWINVNSLAEIQDRKAEIDSQNTQLDEEQLQAKAEEVLAEFNLQDQAVADTNRDIAAVLKDLQQPQQNDNYLLLLQELISLINLKLAEPGASDVLIAFDLLRTHHRDKNRPASQRENAAKALEELAADSFYEFLVATLALKDVDPQLSGMCAEALLFFGKRSVPVLMDRLIAEKDAGVRKHLSEILVRQG